MLCKWCPPNHVYFAISCDGSLIGELGGSTIIITNYVGESKGTMRRISIIFHDMITIKNYILLPSYDQEVWGFNQIQNLLLKVYKKRKDAFDKLFR